MPRPTIAAAYAAALFKYSVQRGADGCALTQRSGLREEALADPDIRVPLTQYLALISAGTDLCGDPAFALHFAEAVPMHDVSLVGLVAQFAESVEAGCDLHNRYGRLALDEGDGNPAPRMTLVRDRGHVVLAFTSPLYIDHPVLAESTFARCLCGIRAMYAASHDGRRWPYLQAIHFTQSAPTHVAEYRRVFDVPLMFGSDRNAWVIDEEFLAFTRPKTDSYAAHAFRTHADTLLTRLETVRSTRGQVEVLLASPSASGVADVTVGSVASALGVSRQTLFRRLKAEGTTFVQVVDQRRNKLALHSLVARRLSVQQTAHELGFSDATAFSRAFKRWTGQSPRAYVSRCDATDNVMAP